MLININNLHDQNMTFDIQHQYSVIDIIGMIHVSTVNACS